MKKTIYSLVLSFVALAFVGCSDDLNEGRFGNDPQSGWLQFDVPTTVVVSGLATEFTVPVALHAPVNKDGLTVTYTVTDVEGSTAGMLMHSGEVTIPKNELVGEIAFSIPETALSSCVKYMITLTSSSRDNVQVGLGDGEKPITHLVTIGKGRDAFLGTYEANGGEYTSVVTAGDAPNELVVSNLLDEGGTTTIFLDPVSHFGTVSYPGFSLNLLFEDGGAGPVFVSDDYATFRDDVELEDRGVSIFDPCNQTLDLTFFLISGSGETQQASNDFNAVLVKQP